MELTLTLRLAVWSIPSIKKLNQENYLKCLQVTLVQVTLVFMLNVVGFVCEQITPPAGSFVYLQPKVNTGKTRRNNVCQETWKDNKRHN